ncbi:MAG: sugar phosphate isomerase/epimerase [Bacteroidetes bacterium]|nr:sugar phosphate isomerase/epimerase [Bacteroidota bacterium]
MKLGFLTACVPQLGLADVVTWASEQKFQAIELAAWPVKSNRDFQARQINAARFSRDDAARAKELLQRHGIVISAMAYYDNNLDPDLKKRKYYLEHVRAVVRAAELLGVPLVGTFVGGRPDKSPGENMKEIGKLFRELASFAADHGVRLMIENCPMDGWQRFGLPGNFAYSPELWDALFSEVPAKNFGLNFDPSHLTWLGIDYIRAAREYASKIFHMHAKDTEFLPDGQYRYGVFGRQIEPIPWQSGIWRYRIPGMGVIDWGRLIATVQEGGYDGVLSIEHEDPVWSGSEEKVKNGLLLGRKHLAQFIL